MFQKLQTPNLSMLIGNVNFLQIICLKVHTFMGQNYLWIKLNKLDFDWLTLCYESYAQLKNSYNMGLNGGS